MDFRVTVVVDVLDKRPGHLQEWKDPAEYAKRFINVTPVLYGSHDVDLVDGQIQKSLTIVESETQWVEAYQI